MEIKQIAKEIGKKRILTEVTTQIEPGYLTALIGPNGAGKSTLLSVMSGLLSKECGEIYLAGKELAAWKPGELAKKLAILKQSNTVNLQLTVRELVAFGRFPYSKGKLTQTDQQIVQQVLQYTGLAELADQFVPTLSGGQLQRAYIALVLAQDTEYILLDEPLNNLDMKYAVETMDLLRRLVDEQAKTVVIVLHDINFAANYSDRIIAMKAGQLFLDGTMEDVIQSEVLSELFSLPIEVKEMSGQRFCWYFNGKRKENIHENK